jgi:predicted RND superfamily exporter protein
MGLPEKVYYGGMPFVIQSLGDIISSDMLFLAPLTAIVIILLLFISFRNWRGVLLPLLTVVISIIWTIGLMGLLGVKISIISDTIPVILLAVGSAYTIHVINRINETQGENYRERIRQAMDYIIIPVFLAAITTMAGFISFIFGSYLTMIGSFGIFMASGVGFALLLSVTFAPALLAWLPEPGRLVKERNSHFLNRPLEMLSDRILKHPSRVIAIWSVILAIAIGGAFMIKRKVDVLDYFKRSDLTYVSETIFREKFGGTMPVYVVVKGDVQSPQVLNVQRKISDFMKTSPEVTHSQSVADLIERMNDVMGEGKKIPADKLKIQQLWFLLEGQDVMSQLVNYELDEGMVSATFSRGGLEEMKKFTRDMDDYIDGNFNNKEPSKGYNPDRVPPDSASTISIEYTGLPSLYLNIDRSLLNSQAQSILYAIILVFLMVALILRSLRLGAFAIVPILVTLIVLFGFMGLTGIPLDIATVLVGSVSIGIGVDYAIHMITHLNYEMKKGQELGDAVRHAVRISGRAICINVLAVALGFLVLVLSNLVPLQRFGILVAVTMIISGSAAITLLPALLIKGEVFRKRRIQKKNNHINKNEVL